jgi:type II secretory pathway predicted ATPase ExeA
MSIHERYGYRENPFLNLPDYEYFVQTDQHISALILGTKTMVDDDGFAVLTGPFGSGKTIVAEGVAAEVRNRAWFCGQFSDPTNWTTPNAMLSTFLEEHKIELEGRPNQQARENALLARWNSRVESGSKVCYIIDEAHRMRPKILEKIMMLGNNTIKIKGKTRRLVNFFLVGQEPLEKKVSKLPDFENRIGANRQALTGADENDLKTMIESRMKKFASKRCKPIFTDASLDELIKLAKGSPRLMFSIAGNCLWKANGKPISVELVHKEAIHV